jgi:hypothetical protein
MLIRDKHLSFVMAMIVAFAANAGNAQTSKPKPGDTGIPKPLASARPNASAGQSSGAGASKKEDVATAWPPPESLPRAGVKRTAVADPSKDLRNAGPCSSDGGRGTLPEFQYGKLWLRIEKCHRSGTHVEFSGVVQYRGDERLLLVFPEAFAISDDAGNMYRVESGNFGGSKFFGREYSFQWMSPGTPAIAFSFIVNSPTVPDPASSAISISMAYNQSTEGVTFHRIREK